MSVEVTVVASPIVHELVSTPHIDGMPLEEGTEHEAAWGFYNEEDHVFYACSSREEFLEFQVQINLIKAKIEEANSERRKDIDNHEIWPYF
jgi:hypothetical protein